jgi:hypothetical protein
MLAGKPEADITLVASDFHRLGKAAQDSSKPKRHTVADMHAAGKPGQDSPISLQSQTPPRPPKRVTFAEQAKVREFPRGEEFKPGEFTESVQPTKPGKPPLHPAKEDSGNSTEKNGKNTKKFVAASLAVGGVVLAAGGLAALGGVAASQDD